MTEGDVQKGVEQIRGLRADLVKAELELGNAVAAFQAQLRAGATTGDPIVDFMSLHFDDFSSDPGVQYRDLQAKVAANIGKLVLVVESTHKLSGYPVGFDERLGAIKNPLEVDIIAGKMVIPTQATAFKDTHNPEWMAVKGDNIELTLEHLGFFGKEDGSRRIKVYFGDDVADFYRKADGPDLDYIHALEMLGQPVPEDFAAKKAAFDLRNKMERVFSDIQQMIPKYKSDVTNIVLRGQAVELFEEAAELGMFEGDFSLNDHDGGGSMTTHVPHYLRTQAREMNLPAPERKPEDAPTAEPDILE